MARKTIPKAIRQKVYEKYNGHCAYCGCKLEYRDMQVDHIVSVYSNEYYEMGDRKPIKDTLADNELNNIKNYNPSCRMCNFYKSTLGIEDFRKRLQTLKDRLEKQFIYRLAKKYGIIKENDAKIRFYYERQEGE